MASASLFAQSLPFPRSGDSHFAYTSGTLKPAGGQAKLDAAVVEFYEVWRTAFLQRITHADVPSIEEGKEQAFVNANAHDPDADPKIKFRSVSEGQGYGMLIAALMAGHPRAAGVPADREKRDFDALYRFFKAHPSVPDPEDHPEVKHTNLMAWQVQGASLKKLIGQKPNDDSDSASDGDMDIAYALLLAEKQWGNAGEINYGAAAAAVISEIEAHDVNPLAFTIKLGDAITPEYENAKERAENKYFATRTSDFTPQHWRAFAKVGKAELWQKVITKTLAIEASVYQRFAPKTGLMPDFLQLPPGPADAGLYHPPTGFFQEDEENNGDGNWSYNACRTPWRLATDYLLTGESSAVAQLQALNAWASHTTGMHPERLNAGYALSGDKLSVKEKGKIHYESAGSCFIAPLAVSAMLPGDQAWLDALWENLTPSPNLVNEPYFESTVKLLCMITVSGNWWDPKGVKGE